MKVVLDISKGQCTVTREQGDPKFYDSSWGSAESRILYHVQQELNKQGHDLIKKRMWKDGHLVSDDQIYLRTRKPSGNPDKDVYIYNASWQIAGADHWYNTDGSFTFHVISNIFDDSKLDSVAHGYREKRYA